MDKTESNASQRWNIFVSSVFVLDICDRNV